MSSNWIGYDGPFPSWEAARAASTGYEAPAILEKAKRALLKVRSGEAVAERDTVLLQRIEYSEPVVAALLEAAEASKGELGVLDFGGSLGSSYFQNRGRLKELRRLRWCVVEQPHFVDCGRETFQDEELRFHASVEECTAVERIDLILCSGVLQYLPDPAVVCRRLAAVGARHVVLDRTPVLRQGSTQIVVERVPPTIYSASYPCRFFARDELLASFGSNYRLSVVLPSTIDAPAVVGTLHADYFCFRLARVK